MKTWMKVYAAVFYLCVFWAIGVHGGVSSVWSGNIICSLIFFFRFVILSYEIDAKKKSINQIWQL